MTNEVITAVRELKNDALHFLNFKLMYLSIASATWNLQLNT